VRGTALLFGFLAAAAVCAVAWVVFRDRGAEPVPPASPLPIDTASGTADTGKASAKPPGPARPGRGKRPPVPDEPGFQATRESCLEFLKRHAGSFSPEPGQGDVPLFPEVRAAALEALQSLDPAAAEPLILEALSGDGHAEAWDEDRLAAAALRIRAGKPDGAETVRAFLKAGDFEDWGAVAAAAAAASWMAPEEGGKAVGRLFAGGFADYDEDAQAAVLRAAAVLGRGVPAEDLRAILANREEAYEAKVLGAAAGALKRLGDDAGRRVLDSLSDLDWAEEVPPGLAARGNGAVLPWLQGLLRNEDALVRAAAARAIGVVGEKSAAPSLQAALKDEDESVRAEAAVALVVLGDAAGIPGARAAVASQDPEVQAAAWKALALAGDPGSKDAAAALLASPLPGTRSGLRGGALLPRVWAARLFAGGR